MTHLASSLVAVVAFAALAAAGCSSSSNNTGGGIADPGTAEAGCKTGPNAAYANPAGTPFNLPAGIVIEGGEMTNNVDPNCPNYDYVEYGSDTITLCMGLRNTGTAEASVTIPAGATFIAKSATSMSGIVLQSHVLTIPASGVKYFYFRPFSINQNCLYEHQMDRYTFGNVVSDPKMVELIGLAKTKSLESDSDAHEVLQPSVWDITDGSGLTAAHRSQITTIPDVKK